MRFEFCRLGAAGFLLAELWGCDPAVSTTIVDSSEECRPLLVLPPKSHITTVVAIPDTSTCQGGTSDELGTVALGDKDSSGAVNTRLFHPNGSGAGTLAVTFRPQTAQPEPSGFFGISADISPDLHNIRHHVFDTSGAPVSDTLLDVPTFGNYRYGSATDPLGGSLVLFDSVDNFHNHTFNFTAQRFDSSGVSLGGPGQIAAGSIGDKPVWFVGGVSLAGNSLAIFEYRAHAEAAWLSPSGSLLATSGTDLSTLLPAPGQLALTPLIGGGIAFQHDGTWSAAYSSPSVTPGPVPAWLSSIPNTTLFTIESETGYADVPLAGTSSSPCDQRLEIRAPSGRLCQVLTFKQNAAACNAPELTVGRDGTVIQRLALETCSGGSCSCTRRFWPALLR